MSTTAPQSGGVVAVRALDPALNGAVVARLDRGTGVLDPERRTLRTKPLTLDRRALIALTSSKKRTGLMVERGWRRVFLALIEVHGGAVLGIPADVARALADELESRGARETTAVLAPLRAHAEHLDAGGPVASSPLGRYMGLGGGGVLSSLGDL